MSVSAELHQIPYEMWVEYVEGKRGDIQTICGLTLTPEIPLDEKKPRCQICWPPRRTYVKESLTKKYQARPITIEAIQVNPKIDGQIQRVLEWGEEKSVPMAWLGEERGLIITVNDRNVTVPMLEYLVQDPLGNILHYPPHLFWTMYEEV